MRKYKELELKKLLKHQQNKKLNFLQFARLRQLQREKNEENEVKNK